MDHRRPLAKNAPCDLTALCGEGESHAIRKLRGEVERLEAEHKPLVATIELLKESRELHTRRSRAHKRFTDSTKTLLNRKRGGWMSLED